MITYNNIIGRFEKFVEDHFLLKTFTHGSPSGVDLEKFEVYPALHVVYTGSTYDNTSKEYSFEVYILDLPPDKAKKIENQTQLVSNAEQVAEDILADMRNGGHIFDFGHLYTVGNASTTPLEETTSNSLAGILLTISIEVGFTLDSCNAPLDGVNPEGSAFPSASPSGLRIKEVDGSPDVVGVTTIIVSDGTLTDDGLGVVTIDTSDKGAGVYLPLIGGTLTGDLIVDTKIGIGTSTPSEQLEVIGDILVSGDTMSDAYKPNAAAEPIKLKNFGGDEVVTVLDSGNVGIGTDSPNAILDVNGEAIIQDRLTLKSLTPDLLFSVHSGGLDSRIHNDGSGNLIFGAGLNATAPTERMRITSAGNVGIGTSSPTEKLDVSGNIKASGNINLEDNGKAIFGDGNDLQIYHDGSNSYIDETGTGSLVIKSNPIVEIKGANNEYIARFIENGSVDLYYNNVLKFETTGSGASVAGELDMNSNKITEVLAGSNNLDAVNYQQLTDAILGVLTYKGVWNASTNDPALVSGVGTLGGYYIVSVAGTTDLDGITDWAVGDWAVFSDLPTDAWQKIDNTSILGGAGTGGKISVWTGSGVSRTLGDSVITEANGGNIGIGATSPIADLQIGDGTTDPNLRVYYLDGTYTEILGYGLKMSRVTSYIRPTNDNINTLSIGSASNTWKELLFHGTTTVFYTEANGESMRISSTGDVGIGTTSPTEKLEVEGGNIWIKPTVDGEESKLYLSSNASNGSALIYISAEDLVGDDINFVIGRYSQSFNFIGSGATYGSQTRFVVKGFDSGGTEYSQISLYAPNSAESFRIKTDGDSWINTSGNVGIGTTSPSHKLTIGGTSSNTTARVLTTTGNANLRVSTNNSDFALIGQGGSNRLDIYDNNGSATRLSISSSGNVGIGTTSPAKKLDVVGDIQTSDSLIIKNATSNVSFYAKTDSTTVGLNAKHLELLGSSSVSDITLSPSSAQKGLLTVKGTGNVGIGTTSPATKLDVVGQDANFISNTINQTVKIGRNSYERFDIYVDDLNIALTAWQDSDSNGNHSYVLNREFLGTGDNNFEIRKTNATQLLIDKDGNVGIGTTSPVSKLDVSGGDVEVQDIASGIIMKSPDGTRYRVTVANGGTLSVAAV